MEVDWGSNWQRPLCGFRPPTVSASAELASRLYAPQISMASTALHLLSTAYDDAIDPLTSPQIGCLAGGQRRPLRVDTTMYSGAEVRAGPCIEGSGYRGEGRRASAACRSAATGRDEVAADDSFLRVGALGGTGHAPFLGAVAAKWKVDFLMSQFLNARL